MTKHGEASFVIRNKFTKEVICETFNKEFVSRINTDKYEAVPILAYLCEINEGIRNAQVS